ncbi:hypothetical protein KC335_g151 [Hortaea werneckii]|nr:hypothetical protein KC335_g151 [Hortaea werneckii]
MLSALFEAWLLAIAPMVMTPARCKCIDLDQHPRDAIEVRYLLRERLALAGLLGFSCRAKISTSDLPACVAGGREEHAFLPAATLSTRCRTLLRFSASTCARCGLICILCSVSATPSDDMLLLLDAARDRLPKLAKACQAPEGFRAAKQRTAVSISKRTVQSSADERVRGSWHSVVRHSTPSPRTKERHIPLTFSGTATSRLTPAAYPTSSPQVLWQDIISSIATLHACFKLPRYYTTGTSAWHLYDKRLEQPCPLQVPQLQRSTTSTFLHLRRGRCIPRACTKSMAPSDGRGSAIFKGQSAVAYDFGKNIAGLVTLQVGDVDEDQYIGLTYTESSLWISSEGCDATADAGLDEALWFHVTGPGNYTVERQHERGAFRYLSLIHNTTGGIEVQQVNVHFTPMPHYADDQLRDYTGYFHCDDELLNRVCPEARVQTPGTTTW